MENKDQNLYHDHLDKCKQCRENPWNLCSRGAWLLKVEAEKIFREFSCPDWAFTDYVKRK